MRKKAILLVGSTGAGKTPLGELLELKGLWGKRCVHFDFGHALRTAINQTDSPLQEEEICLVRSLLEAGALLEDRDFAIAEKLLVDFLAKHNVDNNTLVILNGLPRHTGQAMALDIIVEIRAIVSLDCTPEIAWKRIQTNAGGDRDERLDDTQVQIIHRLEVFRLRTISLLEYYSSRRVRMLHIEIGVDTSPLQIIQQLEAQCFRRLSSRIYHS